MPYELERLNNPTSDDLIQALNALENDETLDARLNDLLADTRLADELGGRLDSRLRYYINFADLRYYINFADLLASSLAVYLDYNLGARRLDARVARLVGSRLAYSLVGSRLADLLVGSRLADLLAPSDEVSGASRAAALVTTLVAAQLAYVPEGGGAAAAAPGAGYAVEYSKMVKAAEALCDRLQTVEAERERITTEVAELFDELLDGGIDVWKFRTATALAELIGYRQVVAAQTNAAATAQTPASQELSRRKFLKGITVGAIGGTVGSAVGGTIATAVSDAIKSDDPTDAEQQIIGLLEQVRDRLPQELKDVDSAEQNLIDAAEETNIEFPG